MAIDDAILTVGRNLPTLRLYGWSPACLSLGYGQRMADVDFGRVQAAGWHVVRRPTGGRAILHVDELTYSLILPADHPITAGGIVESYRRISRALAAGLRYLGVSIEAEQRTEGTAAENGPVCFEVPSHYEITAGGRKLLGSAQVRRRDGFLQHGTLPLWGDITRICDVLNYPDETARLAARQRVRQHAVTLTDVLGHADFTWESVAQAVANGFASVFEADFGSPAELDDAEQTTADRLLADVYGTSTWTCRR